MVRRSSRSSAPTPNHAADALAVAICHALAPPLLKVAGMISRLRGRPAGARRTGSWSTSAASATSSRRRRACFGRAKAGAEIVVETYLHVREDALQLYGFADAAERELFTHLLTVNGIGPKVALAVVSGSPGREERASHRAGRRGALQAIRASARRRRSGSCSS